jgi:hypothetical protein
MAQEIRWVQLPNGIDDMTPTEQLKAFSAASEHRPRGVPWVGMIVPRLADGSYKEVGLSLVGSFRFSKQVKEDFSREAAAIEQDCSETERAWIRHNQRDRGNPEEIWGVGDGLLTATVPARLTDRVRDRLQQLIENTADPVERFEE